MGRQHEHQLPPRSCIEFINSIWEAENTNNNVGKLVTSGLPIDLNFYFVIDNFDYDHKAGEEEDIYYTLKIKKYIPYGVKTVEVQLSGLAAARASALASNNATTNNNSSNTYIVQRGDCLWNIAKACTGNGNDWRQLYELNKSVIGSNPNLIKPGQVLTLPTGWRSPQKVTKLSNISAGTTSASKATNTNAPAGALYTNQSEPALDRTLAFARSVMQEAAKQSGGVKEEKKVFKGYAGKSNGTNTFGYEDEFGDFHVYWPGSGNKRE